MKIYLLNNHEAVCADDRKSTVTVLPGGGGVLSVEGKPFPIRGTNTVLPRFEGAGRVHATFTTAEGIRYSVISPKIKEGTIVSQIDPFAGYIETRMYISDLERKLEETTEELRTLAGSLEHDALGFIIKEED